jgi:Zn-dependent protease with chaperone function
VKILDAPEPELYIRSHPVANAYSAGLKHPYIVMHSALVDQFEADEIMFVLGHELGHIKCGHMLYMMIGRMLMPLLETIGQVTFGAGAWVGRGLVAGFFEWMRQSEFTCDRAGALVCQDPQVAYAALMKIGCGSTRLNDEMNVDAFMEQARHFSSARVEGVAKALTFVLHNWHESHPQVIHRAKDLEAWITSGAYDAILSGDYLRDPLPLAPA